MASAKRPSGKHTCCGPDTAQGPLWLCEGGGELMVEDEVRERALQALLRTRNVT